MDENFEIFRERYRRAMEERFGKENVLGFWGNRRAKIVHVGQAPSRLGVLRGRPFADKTGEKLRNVWYEVSEEDFYDKDSFYLTALGMYFPGKAKNGGDRRPDVGFAKQWLTEELSYLRPRLIVLLGKMAGEFFFPGKRFEELVMEDQTITHLFLSRAEGLLSRGDISAEIRTIILPHASPLNIKWFKDHPEFERRRLGEVRKIIREVLNSNSS